MKKKIITVSCLAVLSLVACGTAIETVNDNVVLESVENQILNDNVEVTITSTPTPVPTLTSTPIPTSTPTPTNTPIPTATSTPTPSESENSNSDYNDDTHFTDAPVEDTGKTREEVIEENNQEAQEEVEKAEEKAEQNPDLPKADTSMYTDKDLKPIADYSGITVDELRNKTQAEFDAISNQWMASLLSGIIPGGNSGGSSGSSNQQDEEYGNGWENPEDEWEVDPDMIPDFSSWGDAPAGGMSDGGSNQQDDEDGKWAPSGLPEFDFSSWGDAPAGGM